MSETTTSSNEERGTERAAHKAIYASLEEARQVKPPSEKFRVYEVANGDTPLGFTWAFSVEGAIVNAARQEGFTARAAEPKGAAPLTAERAAAKLAELSDEELAALGLSRKKSKK